MTTDTVDPVMAAAEKAVQQIELDSATRPSDRHIVLKLAEIMLEVGQDMPGPEGENTHFRYRYYKDTQIMALYRQRLAARGLIILPEVLDYDIKLGETAKGGSTWLTTVRVKYTIVDGHTQRMLEGVGIGQGDDPNDKGANKAMTGAFKFFLMKLFMVGGDADPEADERADERSLGIGRSRRSRDRDDRREDRDDRPRRDEYRGGGGYDDYGDDDRVDIGDSNIEGIQRGGRANLATEAQLRQVRELARDLDWKPADVTRECARIGLDELELSEDPAEQGPQLVKYLESLRSTEIGELLDEMKRLMDRRRERANDDG